MPRILRILNRFNLGGPTYNAAYLSRYLAPEYETMLIGGRHKEDEDSSEFILNSMGLSATIIPDMHREISPVNDLMVYNKLKQIIQDFKPDIVHTHAAKAGMLGRRAAYSLRVPVIVHTFHGHVFHSYFNQIATATFIQIERALAKRTTRIIAISDLQQKELTETYRIALPGKFSVIPLGFDLERFDLNQNEKRKMFRERYGIPDDVVAVGIVGRVVPIKNHSYFIDVISLLKKAVNKKVVAVIVGDGELRLSTEEYARKKGLVTGSRYNEKEKTDVIFTSWIRDVDKVYAGLDVVTLTSKNEGTPVSIIEALASGKPVVSTDAGGVKDVVEHGKSGFIATGEQDFTAYLKQLIENPAMAAQAGKTGKSSVVQKYSYQRLVSDTASLYAELLSGSRNSAKKPMFYIL
jgi:glycosyltransferase involved in cell wall biosynthesis